MQRSTGMNEGDDDARRRAGVRRTAVVLALVAVAFYFGIMLAVGQW